MAELRRLAAMRKLRLRAEDKLGSRARLPKESDDAVTSNARQTEWALRKAIGSLGANDFRPLIDLLHDEVIWISNASVAHFRWGGKHVNRSGAVELLSQLASEFSFTRFHVDDLVVCEDDALALSNVEGVHLATSRPASVRNVLRMKLRDGKLVRVEGFFDTATVLGQIGKLPVAA